MNKGNERGCVPLAWAAAEHRSGPATSSRESLQKRQLFVGATPRGQCRCLFFFHLHLQVGFPTTLMKERRREIHPLSRVRLARSLVPALPGLPSPLLDPNFVTEVFPSPNSIFTVLLMLGMGTGSKTPARDERRFQKEKRHDDDASTPPSPPSPPLRRFLALFFPSPYSALRFTEVLSLVPVHLLRASLLQSDGFSVN